MRASPVAAVSPDADFQWKLLEEDTRTTQASVFAVGTSRNHQTHISTYLNFCNYFGIVPMPANPHNLACYAQFLSRSLRSSDSIAHYLSSVKLFHHLNGFTTFSLDHFEIAHTMKGLKKRLQHRPRQHGRVDIPLLVDLAGCFNPQVPRDAAIWAAIVFSFFTFFRRSNVVLDSKTQFDPKKHLKRRDILVSPAGLLIYVTWTKTLQSRERVLSVPLLPIPGSPICPVAAYTHMCDLIPTEPDQPAFVVPTRGRKLRPLTTSMLEKAFARAAASIGIPAGSLTLHDLRRGGYTLAFQAGVPRELRQLHGDWRSDADHVYLSTTVADRLRVPAALRDYVLRHSIA
ncbi:PREDICTED: uncharacterized protein LOC109483942 [Branchiostoma belcheri]|uniref:Uncharacterized protein LOC109483942 n=1 Tax=Branchiostoma belcheri TaxID=7741 RepID=A0A6P5A068_BRABE|nr:PREDICTED: uncharacterized protein LOC109483942 [Branchiostoma belcheri]